MFGVHALAYSKAEFNCVLYQPKLSTPISNKLKNLQIVVAEVLLVTDLLNSKIPE